MTTPVVFVPVALGVQMTARSAGIAPFTSPTNQPNAGPKSYELGDTS